jgi:uncharacterized damage-inducible protein DinB
MDELDLALLYDYACWANGRVLDAAEGLAPGDWERPLGHSFGSLRDTMVHVLSSEMLWLARWQGASPAARPVGPEDLPTLPELRRRWAREAEAFRAYVAALGPEDWRRTVGYRTLDGREVAYPLWQLFLQVVNHGSHHRAEAASMLTDLGRAPAGLDLIFFLAERAAAGRG